MSRTRDPNNLTKLVQAAARVFRTKGYRTSKVSDVAQEMGVSPATVYLYVESKEALFHLVLRQAFFPQSLTTERLPYAAPPDVLRDLREPLGEALVFADLEQYFTDPNVADPPAHLRDALSHLYDLVEQYATGLGLLERCAQDWPELHEMFYKRGRKNLLARIARFLSRGADLGFLETRNVDVSARLVLESIGWFAMHRHGDPEPGLPGEDVIKETVITSLAKVLIVQSCSVRTK